MKNRKNGLLFGMAVAGLMLLAACQNILNDSPGSPAKKQPAAPGYGRISINVQGGKAAPLAGRTALPDPVNLFDSYVYTFTKIVEGGDTVVTTPTPDQDGSFTLETGQYTVKVDAYIGTGETKTLAATGLSQLFNVAIGNNPAVNVPLQPAGTGGKGTLTYDIKFPATAAIAVTLEAWPGRTSVPLTDPAVGQAEVNNLDAGSYLLAAIVTDAGKVAGIAEAVHIYPSLTTEYSYEFKTEDLITPPYSYTVTFNANGGAWADSTQEKTVDVNFPATSVALPEEPERTNYVFTGWNTESDGTGDDFEYITTVSANTTVYAQWVDQNLPGVVFEYNYEGGGVYKTVNDVDASGKIEMPPAPTREGYTFKEWNFASDGTGASFDGTGVTALIFVYAQWEVSIPLSSNANIRALGNGATGNGNDPFGTYGLYVGGNPATSNGTPGSTWNGTITAGTIGGNNVTLAQNSKVVIIVEEKTVSKVEFGQSANDSTEPTWQVLPLANDGSTVGEKRYVGSLDSAIAVNTIRLWVRITAEDGTTTLVYRYNITYNPSYATLSSLTIGGVTVTSVGTPSGWWNNTVAPDLAAGEVELASGSSVSFTAAYTMGGTATNGNYRYAIIKKATLPIKEGDFTSSTALTFTTTTQAASTTGTISDVLNDGDYILFRAQYNSSNIPHTIHTLIKVKLDAQAPVITAHPQSADYVTGTTPAALTVTAAVTDGGSLTYQWWKSTVSENDEGAEINGQTGDTLPASEIDTTIKEVTTWYWVVVTNTNNNAGGPNKTATRTSNKAAIYVDDTLSTKYTVTFDTNGGTPNIDSIKVVENTTAGDAWPANPTKSGYTFSGWYETSDTSFTGTVYDSATAISKNTDLIARWKSNNAKIRALGGGLTATAFVPFGTGGLYVGGIPANNNGTANAAWNSATGGSITGNSVTFAQGSKVVVIVDEETVSEVYFGQSTTTGTEPTWNKLNPTNDGSTVGDRRYVGSLASAISASNNYLWVRITAEDETTALVYRYTTTYNASYGTLTSLEIGGITLNNGTPSTGTSNVIGTPSGWWNNTVAPDLAFGEVTLSSGTGVSFTAKYTMGGTASYGRYYYAIIPADTSLPLKEGVFVESDPGDGTKKLTFTSLDNNPTSTGTISDVLKDGDYILFRGQYNSSNMPYFIHVLIKVVIEP
jgi:uncharacterized repeat protein (TIGR02543 family)